MEDHNVRELISAEEIARRCRELGAEITRDYTGEEVTLVCVLLGSLPFFGDLAREVKLATRFDALQASSYHGGTTSTGAVELVRSLRHPVEGRHVLVVEDIVDTGLTMQRVLGHLREMNPASLKLVSLLDKPSRRKVEVPVDYIGFTIEDRFVVGYGLDYDEQLRNLPFIGEMTT